MDYLHSHFGEIDSTNAYLKGVAKGSEGFLFVSADHQTAGHGRNGREWVSPSGENLLFSFLLKDPKILALGPKLTLPIAAIIAKRLEGLSIRGVSIKWPNDVYVDGKKVAGILLEGSLPDYIVIGVGINVNQTHFDGDFRAKPTSMALEFGHPINLEMFRDNLFRNIVDVYSALPQGFDQALAYFASHDYLRGKKVLRGQEEEPHVAVGVDEEFNLLLSRDGETVSVTSQEVVVVEGTKR